MKTLITIIGVVVIGMAGLIGWQSAKLQETPMGGVSQASEYKYSQFSGAIATSTLIQTGATTLGSVVITEDSATAVTFWDATSTAAVTDGTYATKMAVLQAALTENTYVFDAYAKLGLVMVSTDGFSFAGDFTVTFR